MAVKQLPPQQAHDQMQKDTAVIYLDVRTESEFTAAHPKNAINIPAFFFQAPGKPTPNPDFLKVVEATISKDAAVLVGCQAGVRSQRASDLLVQAGYSNVTNVMGGFGGGQDQDGNPIAGWRDLGLPISNDNGDGVSYTSLAAKAGVKA